MMETNLKTIKQVINEMLGQDKSETCALAFCHILDEFEDLETELREKLKNLNSGSYFTMYDLIKEILGDE